MYEAEREKGREASGRLSDNERREVEQGGVLQFTGAWRVGAERPV